MVGSPTRMGSGLTPIEATYEKTTIFRVLECLHDILSYRAISRPICS